ncbi:MAG: hypothetical protein K0R00_2278 [Herbinix sp.]|jgi:hypothetical protein|nr:hypothetical protein [Herbinix sp.]
MREYKLPYTDYFSDKYNNCYSKEIEKENDKDKDKEKEKENGTEYEHDYEKCSDHNDHEQGNQRCVTLVHPIIKQTVTKETTSSVKCCIDVPGYEVVSVCNDIKAKVIETSCEIHEDFVCPSYGPIPGVKTADIKIFVELKIPIVIRSYGCSPITVPFTCVKSVVFKLENVFVSPEIVNCEVVKVLEIVGSDFEVSPAPKCAPHCCVEGCVSLTAKISAGVLASTIEVVKCSKDKE